MKDKIKKVLKDTDFIYYFCIVVVACILSIPILNKNLDIYFDDGIQHVARSYGTLKSFLNQGLHANIISEFTNGFGYSWNLFYGPLSTYGIILFNLICGSFTSAYKIFNFVCLILSGIFMYKLMISITKNSNTSLLAASIYLTFPYHLTDWYLRNAIGEFISFVFIPLVFLGLYNLFNTEENHYYLSFGAIGIILTHNICTAITCIFAAIYTIIHFRNLKETKVKQGLILNFIFIVTITSFFWAPMLETKFSADYQVYEKDAMSTRETVVENALSIKELFVTENNKLYVFELGIHVIIMLCFSGLTYKSLKEDLKKQYLFCLITGLFCVIMSTKIWPWKWMPEAALIIQFPWRMLAFAGFFLSIVCSMNMSVVLRKFQFKDTIIISIICILYVAAFKNYIPQTKSVAPIEELKLGVMSGREIEVVAGTAKAEYLPKTAFKNRFYIATRENATYVLSGKAIIENEEKDGANYKAKIRTVEERTIFELPYIYYPGYEVTADGILIENFETENGFLGIVLEENENVHLEVSYSGTKIMKITTLISTLGTILFSIYVWKKH